MSGILHKLGSPVEFWEYFENISKIPRCSGNERHVREYVKNEAEILNFNTKIDKAGNLLVIIPPRKEKKTAITLQSHFDMVCEKNKDVEHDFSKDPLKLQIIKLKGKKWVTAEGTTLGADNGSGIAFSLAIMKKIANKDLKFDNLEINLLFTVSEESTMSGAMQIDKDLLRSNLLINLDSGADDLITIGCVGGHLTRIEIKVDTIIINQIEDDLKPIEINLTNLLGGHSGIDINKGRANPIKLIGKILWNLNKKYSIYVHSINGGGTNRNAIPREANAVIYVKNQEFNDIVESLNTLISEIKEQFSNIEKNMNISIQDHKFNGEEFVFMKNIQDKILSILFLVPNGPISMHPKIQDLVHTSTNFSSIITRKNRIKIDTMQRSFDASSNKEISDKIIELFKLAELKVKYNQMGGFGAWPPNFNSALLKLTKDAYKELFNKEPMVSVIHAGLEPGVFKIHFPDLDMITIGSTMECAHSPDERLDVQSVEKFWKFLLHILKKI